MFELKHVTLNGTNRPRLDDVTITIPFGRTAIVGYSGAGKTSLLNVLAQFETSDSGQVVRHDDSPTPAALPSAKVNSPDSRLPIYWVPQNGGLWPHLTVEQHLSVVNSHKETNNELLDDLDLSHRRFALPEELSQGERSRLAVARALNSNARVILMDEPLSHVDPVRKPHYWTVVRQWIDSASISVVFSSHEPETVLRQADHVICIKDGQVQFQGPTRELYNRPPSRSLGEFLGPLNWFSDDDVRLLLNAGSDSLPGIPVRPDRLILQSDPLSSLEFVSMAFCGVYAESVVLEAKTGRTRTILHQPTDIALAVGQKVTLRRI